MILNSALTDSFSPQRPASVGELVRAGRRWGLAIAVAATVAAVAAFGVSNVLAPEYQATAQLYLTPASTSTALYQDVVLGQNLARSYVPLVTADVVLRPAMTEVGWQDLKTFRERTDVSQVRDTSVINVVFKDRSPDGAAAAANAIAQSFIERSKTLQSTLQGTAAGQLDDQVRSVQAEITSLDSQIAALRAALAAPATPAQTGARSAQEAQLVQLDASRAGKQQTLAQLAKALDDIRLAAARGENAVSLWQPAVAPIEPVSPRIALNTVLGAIAGALLAVLVIAGLRYLDDRMTNLDQVRARLGIASIGEIANAGRLGAGKAGKLFVRDDPSSMEAEDFRSLRTNISFANVDRRPRTILVTSAVPLEGKSLVSANLALAFAQAGTPTILVDADLRRPSQHKLFNIRSDVGVTDLIRGSIAVSTIEQGRWRVSPQLVVIPAGALPPNPAELLSSNRMSALLDDLAKLFEGSVVIIDSSPVLAVTDAAALASKADGCLLVIDSGRTQARTARRALDSLHRVSATILGAVLNKVASYEASYGYYAYDEKKENPAPPGGTAAVREDRPTP